MKKVCTRITLILLAVFAFAAKPVLAQNSSEGAGAIPLTVYVEEQPSIPGGAVAVLTQRLSQVASQNGMAAFPGYGRFCMTAVANATTRDILPGPPTQIAQNLDITFYIVDNFDQKVYATTTISVKGVGTTDEKSFLNALRSIKANDSRLANFTQKGRNAIIEYYNQNCERIIREANVMSAAHRYEESLYALSAVPEACSECYANVVEAAQGIFNAYIDYQCQVNLAKARSAWVSEQNSRGAAAAGEYLSAILPEAACYQEAMSLYAEIKEKVLDDWKFEMKQYQDAVDLESQRINAWKEVGVAYGNNQQPTSYHVNWIVR